MPTVTFTFSNELALRAAAAVGLHRNLRDEQGNPRNATVAELRQEMIDPLRKIVLAEERAIVEAAIVVEPFDPDAEGADAMMRSWRAV